MALLTLQDVTHSFGGPPLLDGASFTVDAGERVTLLGRNGSGKSTVLRLLDGTISPDSGIVVRRVGLKVSRLEQDVASAAGESMFDVVAAGIGATGTLLTKYHAASHRMSHDHSDAALAELDRLHHALDAAGGWQLHTRVETVLSHLGLDPDARFAEASGGRKRQVLLARALVSEPDVLLLDEPTNHLDVNAIEWMEAYLIDRGMALVFVSHDRAFIRRVSTRIVELDRGVLRDWGEGYDAYLERKDAALVAEERQRAEFDKKLAREEAWIRTGIKARRTRNEGRVRALERLRLERAARRERLGTVRLQAQEAERSGRVVLETRDLGFSHGSAPIVRGLTTTIMRGDRIGVIGPNGSGKTTLIRLLLGELEPDQGTVRHGTGLAVAYFDQLRDQLDPELSVIDNISDGTEFIEINGHRRHVMGYLQDFLFTPDRARTPVRVLSGGERNRLLLARLFTRAFNVLVMDEPTNDLDIETLDLLEELLLDYSGTLLLVSHDRAFIDNVVSSTMVLEGDGIVGEYVGGYSDWQGQLASRTVEAPRSQASASPAPVARQPRRLSLRDQGELTELPGRIDAAERRRDALYLELADPAVARDAPLSAGRREAVAALDREIETMMRRWEALEGTR